MSDLSPFARSGRLLADYQIVDWAATPLGPTERWRMELRGSLSLVLATPFPAALLWGPELTLLYNDAYAPLIGSKHPSALGRAAADVFPEAWDTVGPLLAAVLADEGPVWVEDVLLPLERKGFLEECYFTFGYSAIPLIGGGVGGVLDITSESTRSVLGRRRFELLGRVGRGLSDVQTRAGVAETALPLLRTATRDIPAVALYVGETAELGGDPALPGEVPSAIRAQLATNDRYVEESPGGSVAWFRLPVAASQPRPSPIDPVIAFGLSAALAVDANYLEFLRLLTTGIGNALDRAAAYEVERESAGAARSMSEALQRSLLTAIPKPEGMDIVARYVPAALDSAIGGDWYDAFFDGDGGLRVVIGDAAGHDRAAAVAMGQARNVLRGIAYSSPNSPAGVLASLDGAMADLPIDSLATAILGAVVRDGAKRTFVWSNAGHPPPVLIGGDGTVTLLRTEPDLMLGLDPATTRADSTITLSPGSALLMFTDGLVERRGASIDDGLAWLVGFIEARAGLGPADLCDALLAEIEGRTEDDVAMLALRVLA